MFNAPKQPVLELCAGAGINVMALLKYRASELYLHGMNRSGLDRAFRRENSRGKHHSIVGLIYGHPANLNLEGIKARIVFSTGVLGYLDINQAAILLEKLFKAGVQTLLLRELITEDGQEESVD